MKMQIKKSDWSGEESEIRVNKSKNTVYIPELDVTLKLKFSYNVFREVKVYYEDSLLCKGACFYENGDCFWVFCEGDVERSNENPYECAAQMAFNLI